jgi:hypothetical protein
LTTTFALLLIACSAAGPALPASSGDSPGTSSLPATSPDAWLVVGRNGEPDLTVVLSSTLEEAYTLPVGVPGERWGTLVATSRTGATTAVREITVQPDLPARSRAVDGAWRLPTLGDDALPVGVSGDASTIVLVEAGAAASSTTSRFAVLARGEAARILELPGSLEFDALSPDGSILYVVEHLSGPPDGHYQVRAVDVSTGLMRETVIVDKRNLSESMGGWPITQARHPNGVVFTLYQGEAHPFIHALNSLEAWAVCIDLPAILSDDPDAVMDWGLAQSADGRSVWAANATLGLAVAIDPGVLSVTKTAAFEAPRAAATITLAKFGHQDGGPVGRRVAASPDGSALFAAGAGGIVRLETGQLTETGTYLDGIAVGALGLTPDGSVLYALLPGDGRIVKLDAASGEVLGQLPGEGFDRLVAVVPW